jgi:hypothetical protein
LHNHIDTFFEDIIKKESSSIKPISEGGAESGAEAENTYSKGSL